MGKQYTVPAPLRRAETDFQIQVVAFARGNGWMVRFSRKVTTKRAVRKEGDPGFPDTTFAKGGKPIFAELKKDEKEKAKATPDQLAWLAATGGYLWSPEDWPTIEEVLG